jgi:hypothetical protein
MTQAHIAEGTNEFELNGQTKQSMLLILCHN